jgi:hypothetical protein
MSRVLIANIVMLTYRLNITDGAVSSKFLHQLISEIEHEIICKNQSSHFQLAEELRVLKSEVKKLHEMLAEILSAEKSSLT